MEQFVYPAILTPDAKDGGFVVTFVDLPEAITQGETEGEALREAADCLEEAQTAAKAALYIALQDARITKAALAKRLQCDEKEVRRLLDPRHPSMLPRLEAALAAVGRRLIVSLQSAA